MIIYLILLFILLMINSKIYLKGHNIDYIDKDNSSHIKGFFILIVFLSHIGGYVKFNNYLDTIAVKGIFYFGQLMVTLFLFYSGYGVYESIKKKKNKYIDNMPKKRILVTLINFDIAVLTFFIVDLIFTKSFSISKLILSLIGWDSFGNSNWYIFIIILLYAITYLCATQCA